MLKTNWPLLHLHGTPFEQGRQQGRALRRQIAHNLNLYLTRFTHEVRLSRQEVLRRAHFFAEVIRRRNPAYYAGMQGLAVGAGRSFDEIAALNTRYEILYPQYSANARPLVDGCTAFAVPPECSAEGRLIIGQNWDWFLGVQGALLHTQEENGLETLAFTEAGIFGGKIGLNSAGLGLVINGLLSSDDDASRPAKPFHVRCYEVLRQSSLEDALAIILDEERACSANYLVAQAPDRAVNIEIAPHNQHVLQCEGQCLVHTNHFLEPLTIGVTEPDERLFSNQRWRRFHTLLQEQTNVAVDDLQGWLSDHHGYPYAVCQHTDDGADHEQYVTVTSIILDLAQQTMFVTNGAPCTAPYHELSLSALSRPSRRYLATAPHT